MRDEGDNFHALNGTRENWGGSRSERVNGDLINYLLELQSLVISLSCSSRLSLGAVVGHSLQSAAL